MKYVSWHIFHHRIQAKVVSKTILIEAPPPYFKVTNIFSFIFVISKNQYICYK